MRKISMFAMTALLLAGCGTAEQTIESVNGSVNEPAIEVPEATASEETAAGVLAYKPSAGLVKKFDAEGYGIEREVKEVAGNKVLEVIKFGDVKTAQVSEWSETGMQMLFDSSELEGTGEVSIENLVPTAAPAVLIDEQNTNPAAWQIVSKDETVTVPAGTFENVLVISQVFDTTSSDQVTTITQYFAPGLGFIKEKTVIQNGDKTEETTVDLVSYQ